MKPTELEQWHCLNHDTCNGRQVDVGFSQWNIRCYLCCLQWQNVNWSIAFVGHGVNWYYRVFVFCLFSCMSVNLNANILLCPLPNEMSLNNTTIKYNIKHLNINRRTAFPQWDFLPSNVTVLHHAWCVISFSSMYKNRIKPINQVWGKAPWFAIHIHIANMYITFSCHEGNNQSAFDQYPHPHGYIDYYMCICMNATIREVI